MKAGDTAPNFILKDESGNDFELYKNLDKKILLIFYPKDNTPVCSNQLSDYNKNFDEFIKYGIKLIGISADSIHSHSSFCLNLKLKFPLISDDRKIVCKQYDALNIIGINKRLLILIGTEKKVIWSNWSFPFTFTRTGDILKKLKANNII